MKKIAIIILLLFVTGCTIPEEKPVDVEPEMIEIINTTGVSELIVGEVNAELLSLVSPSNASSDVKWTSSDLDVASVENGIVTAIKAGEVTITVESLKDETVKASITFTVIDNSIIYKEHIRIANEIVKNIPDVANGKLPFVFRMDNARIYWSTSDEYVIDSIGNISPGKGDKTVTVTGHVTLDNLEYTFSKDVLVKGYTLRDISNHKPTFTYLYDQTYTGINEGDLEKIDVINMSFGTIINGRVYVAEGHQNTHKNIISMAHEKGTRVVLAIGGWGVDGFSDAVLSQATRKIFIDSIIDIVKKFKYDGIDLDWEYPTSTAGGLIKARPEDKTNFTKFINELRLELDKVDEGLILSMAVPGSAWAVDTYYEMSKINASLSYLHIMSYDLIGYQAGELTNHHTNVFAGTNSNDVGADSAIKAYINAGIDSKKVVLGVAFYGHIFRNISTENSNGYNNVSSYVTADKGTVTYKIIEEQYLNNPEYTVYYDENAIAAWIYGNNTFISFDNEQSISAKAEYILDNNYGGLMTWEYNQDSEISTLLNAMYNGLNLK